jgi:hypothetical protein
MSQGAQYLLNMLQIFLPSFSEDEDVIQNTTTKEFVNYCNISSIICMNVTGELVKPKGMTNHSKRPSLDLKDVFHTSFFSIITWW